MTVSVCLSVCLSVLGGDKAVLNCLVASSQSSQSLTTDHTFHHAITDLGLQEMPRPYKEDSDLINFFPGGNYLLYFNALHLHVICSPVHVHT